MRDGIIINNERKPHLNRHAAVHDVMSQWMLMVLLMLMLVLRMERGAHLLLIMIIHHVLHHRLRKAAHINVDALLESMQARQMLLSRRSLTRSWRTTRKNVEVATFSHKN